MTRTDQAVTAAFVTAAGTAFLHWAVGLLTAGQAWHLDWIGAFGITAFLVVLTAALVAASAEPEIHCPTCRCHTAYEPAHAEEARP